MTPRKKLITLLAIIPLSLLMLVLIKPISEGDQHNGIELIFLILGLPIVLLNILEWSDPSLMDELFGKPKSAQVQGPLAASPENLPGRPLLAGLPGWMIPAVLVGVLALGIALGAGALVAVNKFGAVAETATPEKLGTPANAMPQSTIPPANELTNTPTAQAESTNVSALTPTPEATTNATLTPDTSSAGTPDLSRCAPPTDLQIATIQAGIYFIDSTNSINSGYVVKSIAADELWFIAAYVDGPDIEGGTSSEPGVWSFYMQGDTPYNIFAINGTAAQYTDFGLGPQANPAIDMQVDGANVAYECTLH